MSLLNLALIQTDLYWQNPIANRAMLEEKIFGINQAVDLIALPEMFNTGFVMNPEVFAEPMGFTTMKWMHQMAKQTQAAITGSLAIKENGFYYNRLLYVLPDGSFQYYDKRHLFSIGGEADKYSAGNQQLIIDYKGFKIAFTICYDLRFPVWNRNKNLAYDVLLNVANWPSARSHVWDTLLKARAIENQAYCVGVNRIGLDGNKLPHAGHSAVIDFKGFAMNTISESEEIIYQTINKDALDDFRTKFPAYLDADDFQINGC
jgi:omega-amidase